MSNVEKSDRFWQDLVLVLFYDTEYVAKYNIIEITSWRIMTERQSAAWKTHPCGAACRILPGENHVLPIKF